MAAARLEAGELGDERDRSVEVVNDDADVGDPEKPRDRAAVSPRTAAA